MRRAVPAHIVRAMRISIEPDTWWHRELQCQGIKVSREFVRQLRKGLVYRDLLGDADTIGGASCERCQHWRGEEAVEPCDLGHRDPLADGLGFARICPTFREGS